MSDIAKTVGQRIRNFRTQKGLSQDKLAEYAGVHPTYIGQLERERKTLLLKVLKELRRRFKYHFLIYLKRLMTSKTANAIFLWSVMSLSLQRPRRSKSKYIKYFLKWMNIRINKSEESGFTNQALFIRYS